MISTNSQPSSPFQVRTLLCTVCYLAVLTSSHLIIPAWLLSGAEGLNQEHSSWQLFLLLLQFLLPWLVHTC